MNASTSGSLRPNEIQPFVEEYPPFRGLHQVPRNIREIAANGGLDAQGGSFQANSISGVSIATERRQKDSRRTSHRLPLVCVEA